MDKGRCARRFFCYGLIGLALAARSRGEVVVLSTDRTTTDHAHVKYVPGKQPAGTQADQVVETTTVAPDLSHFQTLTQSSDIGTNPGGGGLLIATTATGSLLTEPTTSTYTLWESWTFNRTAVTFEVVGQPEQFSFYTDDVREAAVSITSQPAPLAYSGVEQGTGGLQATGTLQPGVYTFDVELLTTDPPDFLATIDPSTSMSLQGYYRNMTFSVTPEPASLGAVGVALVACAARPKRRRTGAATV